MIYGNHKLQRGDHDGETESNSPPRWGGVDDPSSPPGPAQTPVQRAATVCIPGYVEQLQRDLRELGFAIVGDPDGSFGRLSEWAVREFQIYASMEHVAQLDRERLHQLTCNLTAGEAAHEVAALGTVPDMDPPESYYVACLRQVANTARYTGPISGLVNERTRQAMRHWLNNDYRCPVVVEAWNVHRGKRTTTFAEGVNLWRHDQLVSATPRIFYRDFSGYYTYPATRSVDEYQVLGTFLNFPGHGGPASLVPSHTWRAEAEIMPEDLIGRGPTLAALQADLAGATASTYRVVRATAEMECMGAFDSVNAYDDAVVSLGPCHWTLGLHPHNGYDDGELAGFLAYVMSQNEADYLTAYGNFGLYPSDAWAGSNRGELWASGQRKYTGWIRVHTDHTDPAQAPGNTSQLNLVNRDPAEVNYYRSWHWFFRWVMAGRTVETVRHGMWDMIRLRLRDVLSIPVAVNVGGATINDTLGNIMTSEKAAAILLRWHIFRPAHVSGSRVRNSIAEGMRANPTLSWALPLVQWTDAHESALLTQLLSDAVRVNRGQTNLVDWPSYDGRARNNYILNNELGELSEARGSFILDSADI